MSSSEFTDKFVGKTIARVDVSAVNYWVFYFTDGTSVGIEVECIQPSLGLYGMALTNS